MENFRSKVIAFTKNVPRGQVVSYSQVAAACGSPRAARQVGAILKALDTSANTVPWWRVLNNKGIISIKDNWTATKALQKSLLIKEGVKVAKDYSLDIEKYRYNN